MTPTLTVLMIICGTTLMIASIMIWKVFDDCDKRMKRRQRQMEARYGKRTTAPSSIVPG